MLDRSNFCVGFKCLFWEKGILCFLGFCSLFCKIDFIFRF